jgi:hypothetical protein
MPKDNSQQRYLYPWHRKGGTGVAFREWLRGGAGLPKQGPISLMQIDTAIRDEFAFDNHKDWQEAMRLCIAELLRRGYGTALYNCESSSWEWTNRFTWPDEFGEGPEGIAAAAVQSWLAFGDSGRAEDLRFATELPTNGAPIARTPRLE